MARKKTPTTPPQPTRERVTQALRSGDFMLALSLARQMYENSRTLEHLTILKDTLVGAATHFAERNMVIEFNRTMDQADRLDPDDPAWAGERACLLARGGRLSDALIRADESVRPRVLGHAADRALRMVSKEFLPDELHVGFDAIVLAFLHHERGEEAAARAALEPIGLKSPFLEWKLLLRGLLAHAAGDDARAAENFARLEALRLPQRLAAPFRVAVDPAWRATLSDEFANRLRAQHEKLNTAQIVDRLREIARQLGPNKPLAPVFRAAESLVPQLKQKAPQLIPRLANCLYHAILHQGQPDDLPRYRKVFGNPPDDPHFYKLQAMIGEHIPDRDMTHIHWKKYDEWLATNPPGWSAALLARARSTVWLQMGVNADLALDEDFEDPEEMLFGLFGPPPRKKKKKPIDPPALECYRRAAELAPDWPDTTCDLFAALIEEERFEEAEAAAKRLLALRPDSIETLTALGEMYMDTGRAEEAAEIFLRASALNPLDKELRRKSAYGVMAHARSFLIQLKASDIAPLLDRHRELLQDLLPAARDVLASVAAMKLGKPEEAANLRERALAVPTMRLAAAYRNLVDSQLAKLKPAEKKAADALFAAELGKRLPLPVEVSLLIVAFDSYENECVTYRGQAAHEKKILAQVNHSALAEAPEEECELLGGVLQSRIEWKLLKKFTDTCLRRFPGNPVLLFLRADAGLSTQERVYAVERRLRLAKQLAEKSSVPRFRDLLPRIEQMLEDVAMPMPGMFDSFFGGRR